MAKLNPFEIEYKTDKGSLTPYISLSFEDSGFHSRFMSRDDQEINTASTTTIEGVDIGAFDKKTIALKQRDIIEINKFETSENNKYHHGFDGLGDISDSILSEQGHVVPISQVEGETEDISTTCPCSDTMLSLISPKPSSPS